MAYPPAKKEKPPWEKHPRPQRRQTSPGPLPGLTLHPISFPVPSAPAGSTLTQPSSPAVDHALPWLSRTPDPAFWLPSPSVNQLAGWGGGVGTCAGEGAVRGRGWRVTTKPVSAHHRLQQSQSWAHAKSVGNTALFCVERLSSGPQHTRKSLQAPELQRGPGQDQQRTQSSSLITWRRRQCQG